MTNTYYFKVSTWQEPTAYFWYHPVEAATYQAALDKVYANDKLVSTDLKGLKTWGGLYKSGRDLYTPSVWDIQL